MGRREPRIPRGHIPAEEAIRRAATSVGEVLPPAPDPLDRIAAAVEDLAAAMKTPAGVDVAEWLSGISAEELAAAVSARGAMAKPPFQTALDILVEWARGGA